MQSECLPLFVESPTLYMQQRKRLIEHAVIACFYPFIEKLGTCDLLCCTCWISVLQISGKIEKGLQNLKVTET